MPTSLRKNPAIQMYADALDEVDTEVDVSPSNGSRSKSRKKFTAAQKERLRKLFGGKGNILTKLFGGLGGKALGGGLAALLVLPLVQELLDTFTPWGPEGRARTAEAKLQRNQLLANALLLGEEKQEGRRNRQLMADERALDRTERRDEIANQQDLARLMVTKGSLRDSAELTNIIQQVAGMAGQLPPMPGSTGGGSILQQMGL